MRFRRRLLLLYFVFCLAMGVIWIRATQLQMLDGDAWASAARKMRQRTERLEARRGHILGADGVVLAEDKPVFQLAVVAWNWQRRGRARCRDCGSIYYERGKKGYLPARCSCDRYLKRGAAGDALSTDPYPRSDVDDQAGNLESLPDGDVRHLEAQLGLAPGELARRAAKRIDEIAVMVENTRKAWDKAGDHSTFRETRLEMIEQDLLMRPHIIVPRVAEEVARLVLTSEDGQYRGFEIQVALRRFYPQGDFAPLLLGWTSQLRDAAEYKRLQDEHGEELITLSTRVGRRGLERAYNWQLHGNPGRRVMELGDQGTFSEVIEDRPPRSGRALQLSIDVGVSRQAEQILEARGRMNDGYLPGGKPSGGFVAMDVETGEILLWAETPRFDLNEDLDQLFDPDQPLPEPDLVNRLWNPRGPLEAPMDLETYRNEVVMPVPLTFSRIGQVAVEPGSSIKPLMALAMLSSGRPPMASYYCGGGTTPKCHHCGAVDLVGAICRSCNPYFAFSLRLTEAWPTYQKYVGGFLDTLGLGRTPGSEIPEWSRGQWLWPWVDFELKRAVDQAQQQLADSLHEKAPELEFALQQRTPTSVGGDVKRLARKLAGVATYVARQSGASKVAVSAGKVRDDGRQVVIRFGLRAAGRPGWFVLPGAQLSQPLPTALAGMGPERAGVEGHVERGGTVWFEVAFERRTGRTNPEEPPLIRPDDGINVAIGQGPVLVTPLQMARAMAVIATGGLLVEPHAVAALDGKALGFTRRRLHLADEHLRLVREGMYGVANLPAGTADHCGFDQLPATVYGKTGTAQLGQSWRPFDEGDKNAGWHHWFVGFAEGQGRTIAFACVLHARSEGGAGLTSAWAVKEILERWYASPASRVGGR